MIKKIIEKIYINLFLNNFIIKIKSKKKYINNYSFDFQNICFENLSQLQTILFSNKYYKKKFVDEKSYSYHCFDWLIVAKKIGGSKSITISKKQIFNWHNKKYSKNSFIWSANVTAKRATNLVYNYDFYAISSNNYEKNIFHNLIFTHYLILEAFIKFEKIEKISIELTKIFILLKIIYKKDLENILSILKLQIYKFIDNNGYHKSYNPSYQAEFINQLHEIKNILLYFNFKISDEIDFQLYNMSAAFNNFFHKDNSIALFNGSNNASYFQYKKIDKQINDLKPKKLDKALNGICIYNDKNKKIFFDIVRPTNKQINQNLHSGTLSFEMSCLGEKIVTNCGSMEKRHSKKPEYFRYSAAHSTLILNNTNISELSKNSYRRIPQKISFDYVENDDEVIWIASHNGYHLNFSRIIKRKLKISKNKNIIAGEDSIILSKYNSKKILYNIRFHLTPNCSSLLANNKRSVFIKTSKNQSWIFNSTGILSLEDSICIKDGKKIEQIKQIVITNYADVSNKTENWSFVKV